MKRKHKISENNQSDVSEKTHTKTNSRENSDAYSETEEVYSAGE